MKGLGEGQARQDDLDEHADRKGEGHHGKGIRHGPGMKVSCG